MYLIIVIKYIGSVKMYKVYNMAILLIVQTLDN